MSEWQTLNCANHPERIALERCEVCRRPLCAYCLFYTEDGQRLCEDHAADARNRGARIEEPSLYSDQLIGAQMGALRKDKRGRDSDGKHLYVGNSNDLISLIGLIIGLVMLGACCSVGYCLPVIPLLGFGLSLAALVNARKAYDTRRTRNFGIIGMVISGVWLALIAGCLLVYGLSLSSLFNSFRSQNFFLTVSYPTDTPTPTATPQPTPTVVFGP